MSRVLFISLIIFIGFKPNAQTIELFNQTEINTAYNEFSPARWNDFFIYVSDRESKNKFFYDLKYTAVKGDGEMIRSAFLPEMINSTAHEGPAVFDERNNILYLTRSHSSAGKLKVDASNQVQLKIYASHYKEGQWSKAKMLDFNREGFSYCHPSLSKDGKVMVFASNENTVDGKMDLWMIEKDDETWSTPERLDSSINVIGNQWFPFLSGDFLFYASDHKGGESGLDIYIKNLKDFFAPAQLLEQPFNSEFDDFGFYLNEDKKTGYISSNRPEGNGGDDIYRFTSLEDLTNKTQTKEKIVEEASSSIPEKSRVQVQEKEEKQLFNPSKISTNIGATTVFDKIYFLHNSDALQDGATGELDELINLMWGNPNLKVQLSAHTDSRGSETYNQSLSDKRALTAKNYLISNGISASRIIALGFGESRLRNHCTDEMNCTEEQHRYNRRLEIKVVDN